MGIRNILLDTDPILRKKSRDVEKFDEKLWELLDDMAQTLYENNGVGLAAVQIGILRRVFIVDIGDGLIELINPQIIKTSGEQTDQEGCLSSPMMYAPVKRPNKVTIQGKNRYGKDVIYTGEELLARAFCHENDHLNGVLYSDVALEAPKRLTNS